MPHYELYVNENNEQFVKKTTDLGVVILFPLDELEQSTPSLTDETSTK